MRSNLDTAKLDAFVQAIGRMATGPGRVYLVGGATALLLGIRDQTIDVDIKLDPEPKGIFESISILKERLEINVELSSPDQFIPPLPGWRERSELITKAGEVEFFHYDFYGQVMSKITRGHRHDLTDASEIIRLGKVDVGKLSLLFEEIQPNLVRYPAINPAVLRERFEAFISELGAIG